MSGLPGETMDTSILDERVQPWKKSKILEEDYDQEEDEEHDKD
jgi:hypothetical protein